MSKQDPTDQVKFLVACIGHTANGRPDFQAVATDLGIVSKAAAQKRYERMLKANGVSARPLANNSGGDEKTTPKSSPTKRKANASEPKPKKGSAKKVKSEPDSPTSPSTPVKSESDAKEEEADQSVIADSAQHDNSCKA